jgi:SOS-response transcriptional repressor LexA
MPVLSKKITWALTLPGVTRAVLKRLAGARSDSTVSEWLRTGRIDRRHFLPLAELTGTRVEWWIDDTAPIPPSGHWLTSTDGQTSHPVGGIGNIIPPSARMSRRLPVIDWALAGACDPYAPGTARTTEDVDEPTPPRGFALVVRGDSMTSETGARPHFPDGCTVLVDPDRTPVAGDFIVVRAPDWTEATFKQLVVDAGVRLLRPLNRQYPTIPLRPDMRIVGVVTMKIEKQRF